jgi:hypothetical protein
MNHQATEIDWSLTAMMVVFALSAIALIVLTI